MTSASPGVPPCKLVDQQHWGAGVDGRMGFKFLRADISEAVLHEPGRIVHQQSYRRQATGRGKYRCGAVCLAEIGNRLRRSFGHVVVVAMDVRDHRPAVREERPHNCRAHALSATGDDCRPQFRHRIDG